MTEPTLYDKSVVGRTAVDLPTLDVPPAGLPDDLRRPDNGLPELSQVDVMRHYLRLSQQNFGVDSGFYPLGSCTMKYNPKTSEAIARLDGFAHTHPLQDPDTVQANLGVMYRLQEWLTEIGGFGAVSLQPAAGAHGELTGLLMIRAYHRDRGDGRRRQILIPDSAHGTNPASTSMAGFTTLQLPSDDRGNIDLAAVRAACDESVAGIMLTNPNTLGLFEEQIEEVTALVHGCGGLVYGDGANMNALTGVIRPADVGIDIMHYNLHKTFSTPHGGGGPGSGPVAVVPTLADYLPGPLVALDDPAPAIDDEHTSPRYRLVDPPRSIGRMCTFHGNFAMLVRAYAYIRMHGDEGLRQNALHAVLNANYLRVKLHDTYPVPFDRVAMHEFVCQGRIDGSPVRALDISKRLIDHGFHPPTNYFP
ncbi:MAG: aminomethyl-transferring glycine dehydrogenase subunit GcvPB, partial [Acidimicrobiia bacterium]|nr:aminomethyl-transferring glycine dehydrogenase subunit GcvPB [Acidimicrobiia bacterium]